MMSPPKTGHHEVDAPVTGSPGGLARRAATLVPRWEPLSVFVVTLLVLSIFIPRIVTYLDPLTGDEPFYLMTAISMWEDHDLNECNNYQQVDEARLYPTGYSPWTLPEGWKGWDRAPFPLPPHPAQIVPASRQCAESLSVTELTLPSENTGSELYSKHGLGLTLLVLPSFVLGGRTLVVFFLAILGAALAANIYLLAREVTGRIAPALLTWVAFAFTVPLMPYSYLIFPELPAALMTLYAFRRIRLWHNNVFQVATVGACMAFLPWLHYRFAPISLGLFAYFVYQDLKHRERAGRLTGYLFVLSQAAVSASLLAVFFWHRYGTPYPNPDDHAGINDFAGTVRGVVGSFIDEQWGLFVAAPIFILAIVGIVLMVVGRRWRVDLMWMGLMFAPYLLVVANYAQWWGEWCPPGRYAASVLPLLALPFAVSLDNIKGIAYRGIYGVLLLPSLLVMVGFLYQPQWMYNQPTGDSQLLVNGLPLLVSLLPANLPPDAVAAQVADMLPTFVVPYFAYTRVGQDLGDAWSALAWEKSLAPALFIGFVVFTSLALAWRPWRRGRAAPPDESHVVSAAGGDTALPVEMEPRGAVTVPAVEMPTKESGRP